MWRDVEYLKRLSHIVGEKMTPIEIIALIKSGLDSLTYFANPVRLSLSFKVVAMSLPLGRDVGGGMLTPAPTTITTLLLLTL